MNHRLLAFTLAVVVAAAASCDACNDATAPSATNESIGALPPSAPPPPAAQAGPVEAIDDAAPSRGGASAEAAPARAKAKKDESRGVGTRTVNAFEKLFDGDTLIVRRNGARRIDCGRACALEEQCGFRDAAACRAASCDDDVRRPSRMDYCLALDSSVTCLDAARCSCNESCWKRGECSGNHDDDDECERSCNILVRQEGLSRYRENRCVLEHACTDIAICSSL